MVVVVAAVVFDHDDDTSRFVFVINRVVEVDDGVTNADTSASILEDDVDTTIIVVAAVAAINGIFFKDDDRVLFFIFLSYKFVAVDGRKKVFQRVVFSMGEMKYTVIC